MKIKIKKGLDLNIAGSVTDTTITPKSPTICAICPDDYPGFKAKVDVKEGDSVIAGSPLMHDKTNEEIKLVSPVAGKVKTVVRGERRKVVRIEIEPSSENASRQFEVREIWNRDDAMRLLAESGLMAEIRQRPYDIVPGMTAFPRDIFVTAIDSAPLAVSPELGVIGKDAELAAAVRFLKSICLGKIYVSTRPDTAIKDIEGAEMVQVVGPHPAGNAGVQAANIAPVNKGDTVWTMDIVTLARIGSLVLTGRRDFSTLVAVTGPEVSKPGIISTVEGAAIADLIADRLEAKHHRLRIVSGNLLSGIAVDREDFVRFPYRHLSVISDGDDVVEFMGWASFSPKKESTSPTFPGHFSSKPFSPDARLNGGRRAMIMSGEYDRVIPMDIMAEYLIKAILSRNIDSMEQLGIYEVAPEDFGAAEYVDTSKLPLQHIVREGLDYLREALE